MRTRVRSGLFVLAVFLVVIVLWVGIGFLPVLNHVPGFDFSKDGTVLPEWPGVFGDSFGWVNSLFSALAFAGVLVTLWMQRHELQLQREEMKMTRQELEMTRDEHHRVAEAQEGSENRLFLAAYTNALEALRQLSQWRMSADPATTKYASYPVVEGLVVQARVNQSLQILVRDMEPEIRRIHPAMAIVSEEGSWVWQLERLMSIYLNLRNVLESHGGRSDDVPSFDEAVNIVRVQMNDLQAMKGYCGPHRHATIDSLLSKAPDPKWLTGDIRSDRVDAREARKRFFGDLQQTNKELLSFIMSMCHE